MCNSGLNDKKDVAEKLQRRVMEIIKGVKKFYYIKFPELLEVIWLRIIKIKKIVIKMKTEKKCTKIRDSTLNKTCKSHY